jgi:hypothetical protein
MLVHPQDKYKTPRNKQAISVVSLAEALVKHHASTMVLALKTL